MPSIFARIDCTIGSKYLWIRFFLAGLPTFCGAILFNRYLVESLHFPPAFTYAAVLIVQMSANFLICRYLVFESARLTPFARAYIAFMSGNAVIRLLDWAVYAGFVSYWPRWYLGIQIGNVFVFSVAKYLFARAIFSNAKRPNP